MDRRPLKRRSDDELLELARRDPRAEEGRSAFDLFVSRHRAFAVGLARSYVADQDLAEDFAQEGFFRLYLMLPRYKSTGTPRGLLARIIRNACLAHLKRERRVVASYETLEKDHVTGDRAPCQDMDRRQIARRVAGVVASLSPLQQDVVRLRYFQGLSYAETATALEISIDYVGVLLHQALRVLRKALRTEQ